VQVGRGKNLLSPPTVKRSGGIVMAEKKTEELLKKYLGISVPRLIIAILMIIFGIVILVRPEIVGILVGIYLLISGILSLVDELRKRGAIK
jgi:uncharacterized membrane protein HdeD (DUF308 family)